MNEQKRQQRLYEHQRWQNMSETERLAWRLNRNADQIHTFLIGLMLFAIAWTVLWSVAIGIDVGYHKVTHTGEYSDPAPLPPTAHSVLTDPDLAAIEQANGSTCPQGERFVADSITAWHCE